MSPKEYILLLDLTMTSPDGTSGPVVGMREGVANSDCVDGTEEHKA